MPRRRSRAMYREELPLDPECPNNPVVSFQEDPITQHYGLGGDEEFTGPMAAQHLKDCERCQKFAVANIDVIGP